MNQAIILFFLFYSLNVLGQNSKTQNSDQSRIMLLEEKLKSTQEKLERLEKENEKKEKQTIEVLATNKKETIDSVEKYSDDTKSLINLYVFFITAAILVIGFLLNFFGKNAVKKRVEELISETAQAHIESKIVDVLNSRITNEIIETAIKSKSEKQIQDLIGAIQQKGDTAINQIKNKGEEIIQSMLASPPKIERKVGNKHNDKEISIQNNSIRADEFFNLAFNSNDPRIQIELYKNVIELDPYNSAAYNNMAVSFNNLNEPDEAIKAADNAIRLNPENAMAFANRAQAYNLKENLEKALKDIAVAIDLNPKFEFAYSVKGNILTKQGKLEDAKISINKAVEFNPDSAEAYYNRAFFYEERGDYDKSKQDYEKAESLGMANKALLYNNMAVLYRRLKQFDTAIQYIEKARQFNPDFPNIDGTLALIYADMNNEENFYKHLKIALEKGCQAWNYLQDPGFNNYRDTTRLKMLIEPYRKKYYAK